MNTKTFKIGDQVKIQQIPPDLTDAADIDTPGVFARALGKTFSVVGVNHYGLLELEVSKSDTIWIEPEFVARVRTGSRTR